MFDWKGYVLAFLRNVISVCCFIGAVCAFLSQDIIVGVLFIIMYAFAAVDETWYFIPEDEDGDDDDET